MYSEPLHIGAALTAALKRRKITQLEFAARMDISRQWASKIMYKESIQADLLLRIVDEMGIPLQELLPARYF